MLGFIALLFVFKFRGTHSYAFNCSITIFNDPASEGLPCVFPFIYYGKTYDKCTTAYEADKRPWCATKVSETSRELRDESNDWGYCDPRCPFIDFYGNTFPNGTTVAPSVTRSTELPHTGPSTSSIPMTSFTPMTPFSDRLRISSSEKISNEPFSESGKWLPSSSRGECGRGISVGFIVGGNNANFGEFPFTALIGYDSIGLKRNYDYLCGGVLINRRYVLTAAHCQLVEKPIATVVLGEFDSSKDPDCERGCVPVQRFSQNLEVVTHPLYSLDNNIVLNDIALVRLPRLAITMEQDPQTFVSPICLPSTPQDEEPNDLIVVGWGRASHDSSDFLSKGIGAEILQKLKVKKVPNHICSQYFKKISENQLCAGGKEGEDSCSGDSGSPLFSKESTTSLMVLYGIVSFGTYSCGIGAPGVFTRVSSYMDWIHTNLKL